MGWNDYAHGWRAARLPGSAFAEGYFTDFQNDWLQNATEEQQMQAMSRWFYARYKDPADLPRDDVNGGYLFLWGGPYNPADVLVERFKGIVPDEVIRALVDELHEDAGDEWAPIDPELPDDFDVEVTERSEPIQKLRERLSQSQEVLTLEGSSRAKELALKLVFNSAITALESFLWETVVFWVDHDEAVLVNIVTKLPYFKEQTIKVADVFTKHASIKDDVKSYLHGVMWHNWAKAAPLFQYGLEIKTPSFKPFEAHITKRHDIAHRSGFTKDGQPVLVFATEIHTLCRQIIEFAEFINEQLDKRTLT